MKTTRPHTETAERYCLPGIRFSLATDSVEVRDFFRASYRHFPDAEGPVSDCFPLTALLHADNGRAVATAGDERLDLSGRPMPVNRAFLFLLNAIMERISDFILLHGAAVSVNGRGIVLAGPPTAGKSTLVLELARRGAAFLSDDVAPLSRATGLLHPFPRAIGIRREGELLSRIDRSALPPESVHELAYKWLVDPRALGLRLAGPGDAPCPLDAIFLLDLDEMESAPGRDRYEIALAEEDHDVLSEVRSVPGVLDLRRHEDRPFPVYTFRIDAARRPMGPLADILRRRRDVVLYMDASRPGHPERFEQPVVQEARTMTVVMELARDLLNRSESGELLKSCGGLSGLVAEMGSLLKGARTYRLRPGNPGRTAELLLAMATGRDGERMKGES